MLALQSQELNRLKRMVIGLGFFILIFSSSGFVVFDVYLLSNISENRMHFLDRTMNYLQTSLSAMIMLRNMELLANFTDLDVGVSMEDAKRVMMNASNAMSQMHSLNYISPPTQQVADFFSRKMWTERNVVGGNLVFETVTVNFWDLMNDFILAIQTASQISVSDLSDSDYLPAHMNARKRAVAFM